MQFPSASVRPATHRVSCRKRNSKCYSTHPPTRLHLCNSFLLCERVLRCNPSNMAPSTFPCVLTSATTRSFGISEREVTLYRYLFCSSVISSSSTSSLQTVTLSAATSSTMDTVVIAVPTSVQFFCYHHWRTASHEDHTCFNARLDHSVLEAKMASNEE